MCVNVCVCVCVRVWRGAHDQKQPTAPATPTLSPPCTLIKHKVSQNLKLRLTVANSRTYKRTHARTHPHPSPNPHPQHSLSTGGYDVVAVPTTTPTQANKYTPLTGGIRCLCMWCCFNAPACSTGTTPKCKYTPKSWYHPRMQIHPKKQIHTRALLLGYVPCPTIKIVQLQLACMQHHPHLQKSHTHTYTYAHTHSPLTGGIQFAVLL